jgi:uncharacterized protein YecE (DUF72 family)
MTEWKIGCAGFHMKLESYVQQFRVVEVQETFYDPPSVRTLARWKRSAPEGFSFVLRAWQLITHPPESPGYQRIQRPWKQEEAALCGSFQQGDPVRKAWETLREAAEVLDARAILFRTPAAFTPTDTHRRNMVRFFSSLDRGNRRLVWDPEGVWQEDEVAALCRDLDLIPAQDPLLHSLPPGRDFYFRLKTKTRGRGGYGSDDFYRILEKAESGGDGEEDREGFVIWNTPKPDRDAKNFQAWVARTLGDA